MLYICNIYIYIYYCVILHMYIYIYVCAYVCVDHLKRCKTPNYAGGWSVLQMSPSNEDASVAQWYGLGTLNPRTCSIFFRNGKRLNPRTSMSSIGHVNFFCTVVAIWNYFRSNLYGSATSEPSSEQGRRKHTSNWISRWINHFLLSDPIGLLVHVRCIPHQ